MPGLKLKWPTLIVVCGRPLAGKSTVAKILQKKLADGGEKVHWNDIDEVRRLLVGLPYPHPNESHELTMRDGQEMGAAYRFMNNAADWHLANNRSLIMTYTMSRKVGQDQISALTDKYAATARVVVIYCEPVNDTEEEIMTRLSRGFGEGGYVGGVNSYGRYKEVKDRFEPIELPHCTLDTSPPNTPEQCAQAALDYLVQLDLMQ